jgi:enamine deaminase RidA (YjgF/YER057c/UK114 family)
MIAYVSCGRFDAPAFPTLRDIGGKPIDIQRIDPGKCYALAVAYGGLVQTAGLVAGDLSADAQGQTRQVLAEIDRVLKKAGADKSRLIVANIWLKDIGDFSAMNEVWPASCALV